jgi:alanyl aminopeptidase
MVARCWPLGLALACAGAPPASESAPAGRLSPNVRPLHYALDLEIIPARHSFSGEAAISIELTERVGTIWLHGENLAVSKVVVESDGEAGRAARWVPTRTTGVAAVRLPEPFGPGELTLRIQYSAEFDRHLEGLYRIEVGEGAYAFTQFEAIWARRAFPGFDEPAFKTPFDVTLTVGPTDVAVANTPALAEEVLPDGRRRIRYQTTPPLPTYLLAWIVGPLDVVEGALPAAAPRDHALPFRGVAARGRGHELAYALEHTPPLLEGLERYFGEPYPFAKLDVIAVPDFSAGAMENVGAITFRDSLLLIDPETAPESQLRRFTGVMTHELAHSWFGNVVTMPWWDDLWLNESFATWMASRIVEAVRPEDHANITLLRRVHWAMNQDSLASARRIREPITSNHDIANAFDGITYSKGAGVLSMFESWLGEEAFRTGIRRFIGNHRFGSGEAADFAHALSEASGRDVARPLETFLTQPGVPFLRTDLVCDARGNRLSVEQSRYRFIGSTTAADTRWQIPVCMRYGVGGEVRHSCALLVEVRAELPLEGDACPDWILPNARGTGYYRWAESAEQGARLRRHGWEALDARERLAIADSLSASFYAGTLGPDGVFGAAELLARDPHRSVAEAPMAPLRYALEYLADESARPALRRFATSLYAPLLSELGLDAAPHEDGERRLLRRAVVSFLALHAQDAALREELARRGRAYAGVGVPAEPDAVAPDLVGTALSIAVQDGGADVFAALLERLAGTQDAVERWHLLEALAASLDPADAERARQLALDPMLRVNEMLTPLRVQMQYPQLRDATWSWIEANYRELAERAGGSTTSELPWLASAFCEEARADALERFFAPRIDDLEGGPRNLAGTAEEIRLCAALARAQGPATNAYFAE